MPSKLGYHFPLCAVSTFSRCVLSSVTPHTLSTAHTLVPLLPNLLSLEHIYLTVASFVSSWVSSSSMRAIMNSVTAAGIVSNGVPHLTPSDRLPLRSAVRRRTLPLFDQTRCVCQFLHLAARLGSTASTEASPCLRPHFTTYVSHDVQRFTFCTRRSRNRKVSCP